MFRGVGGELLDERKRAWRVSADAKEILPGSALSLLYRVQQASSVNRKL